MASAFQHGALETVDWGASSYRCDGLFVPTMRLDPFLNHLTIGYDDNLKIDAQGADFGVLLSLGERLQNVGLLKLEVAITPDSTLLPGAKSKAGVVLYATGL